MSGATRTDVFRLIGFAESDLRGVMAKLTEIRSMLAAMNLPAAKPWPVCPLCKAELGGPRALAFHLANVHDGSAVPLSPEEDAA